MSRNLHYTVDPLTNKKVEVILGWDRPLQGFFMDVRYTDTPGDEEDEYLYNNLDDLELDTGFSGDLGYFLEKLRKLNIDIPITMVAEVIADKMGNAGNKIKTF